MRNPKFHRLAILLVAISPFLSAQADDAARANEPEQSKAAVSALIKKGIGKAKEEDFHQAIGCFNEALKVDPKSYDGFVNRGWTFRQMGDFEKAIADYTSAIGVVSSKPQVYLNRGWCHKRLNHYDEALKDFNKAIELDPKYINAYRNRGSLKLKTGDYAGSIADFNQVMLLDPNSKTEVAKYVPAEYMEATKNLDPKATAQIGTKIANAIQGTSIEINETDLAKLNNKAARAIKTGEFATAIAILEDITKKKPNYTFAKENLTTAYNNQGLKLAHTDVELSAAQFRKALFYSSPQQNATRANLNVVLKSIGKDPESDTVRIGIADELRQKGDYKGAFVEYMEAMRLKKSPEAQQKISEILALIEAEKKNDPTSVAEQIASSSTPSTNPVAEPRSNETSGADDVPDPTKITNKVPKATDAPEIVLDVSNAGTAGATTAAVASSDTKSAKPADSNDIDSWGRLPGAEAKTQSLNPEPKVKIGHDKDTYKLKWHNHVSRGDELFEKGDYKEAENEYRESLGLAKKLDDGGSELVDSLERLSRIFLVQKRPVEALSLLEQAYSLRKDTQISPDPVGLERLGKKVLALRHMLYPHQKPGDEGDEEEKIAEETTPEDKIETAAADTPLRTPRKRSPFAMLKRKKTNHEKDLEKFEEAGESARPSAYSNRPSWDEFHR